MQEKSPCMPPSRRRKLQQRLWGKNRSAQGHLSAWGVLSGRIQVWMAGISSSSCTCLYHCVLQQAKFGTQPCETSGFKVSYRGAKVSKSNSVLTPQDAANNHRDHFPIACNIGEREMRFSGRAPDPDSVIRGVAASFGQGNISPLSLPVVPRHSLIAPIF